MIIQSIHIKSEQDKDQRTDLKIKIILLKAIIRAHVSICALIRKKQSMAIRVFSCLTGRHKHMGRLVINPCPT